MKALIVDDNEDFRLYLRLLLERRYGFEVLQASNGLEALEILEKDRSIKLLMTDCRMPWMSGEELIRRVKNSQGLRLKIIAISEGLLSDRVKEVLFAAGADYLLQKPFESKGLEEALRAVSLLPQRKVRN